MLTPEYKAPSQRRWPVVGVATEGCSSVRHGTDFYRNFYRNFYRTGRNGVEAISTLQPCSSQKPS